MKQKIGFLVLKLGEKEEATLFISNGIISFSTSFQDQKRIRNRKGAAVLLQRG